MNAESENAVLPNGWRRDLEDYKELNLTSSTMIFKGVYTAAPTVTEPWKMVHQENQGSQGSCQGNALSTIVELCYAIASGKPLSDQILQLSRQYAYIETQRLDGLIGRDQGSTINGGVKLAKTRGICEEALWPYTGRYVTKPAQTTLEQCYENALQSRIAQHFVMHSYEDVLEFIDRGTGGVSFGIGWGSSVDRPIVDTYKRGGGGHAIAVLFKSPRKDTDNRPYMWMNNSWGQDWGNNGWSEWSPKAIQQMIEDDWTAAVGLTDMVEVKTRRPNYGGLI